MSFFDDLGNAATSAWKAASGAVDQVGTAIGGVLPEISSIAKSANQSYGGLINAGVNALGGLMANKQSAASAQSAQDFSAEQYAHRYQTTVKDLEAAGLSPMLAYAQGAGSSPSGTSYTAQNPFAGVSSAYSSTRNLDVQRENIASSTSLNDEQAALANDTARKVREETKNVSSQGEVLKATVKQLESSAKLMDSQGVSQAVQTKVLTETVRKLHEEGTLLSLDVKAAEALGNVGREAGQLKPIFDIIRSVLSKR